MALYTLADLHLATGVEKPMDIFGGRWQGHTDKIVTHWRALIAPEDTVVLGGDISWGISLAEAAGQKADTQGEPRPLVGDRGKNAPFFRGKQLFHDRFPA